jgi:hypothetical protein
MVYAMAARLKMHGVCRGAAKLEYAPAWVRGSPRAQMLRFAAAFSSRERWSRRRAR